MNLTSDWFLDGPLNYFLFLDLLYKINKIADLGLVVPFATFVPPNLLTVHIKSKSVPLTVARSAA